MRTRNPSCAAGTARFGGIVKISTSCSLLSSPSSSTASPLTPTAVYSALCRIETLKQPPISLVLRSVDAYMLRSEDGALVELPDAVRQHMAHIPPDADTIAAPFWQSELLLFVRFCTDRLTPDELDDTTNLLTIITVADWCGAADVLIAMRDDILVAAATRELTDTVTPKIRKMYDGLV